MAMWERVELRANDVQTRFYCIWDSFRAQHPLLSIIDPMAQTKMVRTMIDIYRNLGT